MFLKLIVVFLVLSTKLILAEEVVKCAKGSSGVDGRPGAVGNNGPKGGDGDQGLDGPAGIPGKNGEKGEKGDKGDRGLIGNIGNEGSKGENGEDGQRGPVGAPGHKGQEGSHGKKGSPGSEGAIGKKGEKGNVGASGVQGDMGKIGPRGDTGLKGVSGPVGLDDTCRCPKVKENTSSNNQNVDGDVPAQSFDKIPRACKYLNNTESATGEHQLSKDGTKNTQFKATCKKHSTCLNFKVKNLTQVYYTTTEKLLSIHKFDVSDGIDKEVLLSLQSLSTNATQYITINCLNSYVDADGNNNVSRSISFVMWNDVILKSDSTRTSPHYSYTVIEDGCKDSSKSEKFTKFLLWSDRAGRLPVTHMHVRDLRSQDQYLHVRENELCFD